MKIRNDGLTIIVQGDTIKASAKGSNAAEETVNSIILPDKYKSKFSGGYVMIEIKLLM
jgi:hypothetical protein